LELATRLAKKSGFHNIILDLKPYKAGRLDEEYKRKIK